MPNIIFQGKTYQREDPETVLDALLRQGVAAPSSCRQGDCQTCMMKAIKGEVPASSQKGIKPQLQSLQYFLPCICHNTADIEVAYPDDIAQKFPTTVVSKSHYNQGIVHLTLKRPGGFEYRAGQFINLIRGDGVIRSYSLASLPTTDTLDFHVRVLNDGEISRWISDDITCGDEITISDAKGSCFYSPGAQDQNILMVGTGTGLAPLWGILRDALAQEHQGEIHIYHGGRVLDDLYLDDALQTLDYHQSNVHYNPSLSQGVASVGYHSGRASDLAMTAHPDLKDWRVYLCGHPEMVKTMQRKTFLAGANMSDIFADAFSHSSS